MRLKKTIDFAWIFILIVCTAGLLVSCQRNAVTSEEDFIGAVAAKEAALADSGEDAAEVTFTRSRLETDGGTALYRVEFYSAQADYEYEIDAANAEILENSKSILRHPYNVSDQDPEDVLIGSEKARELALRDAGLKESDVRFDRVTIRFEEGRNRYRICFSLEDTEYEYDIDASSGEVLRKQIDDEDE